MSEQTEIERLLYEVVDFTCSHGPTARETRTVISAVLSYVRSAQEKAYIAGKEQLTRDEIAAALNKALPEWRTYHDRVHAAESRVASLEAEVEALRGACKNAKAAIQIVPEAALGYDQREGYPYRDELLHELNSVLAAPVQREG